MSKKPPPVLPTPRAAIEGSRLDRSHCPLILTYLWEENQVNSRKLKKQREAAVKLSRPRPVELPSGKWRCQVMVDGKRFDVIEDDPATAHAKALAVKAGLLEQEKSPKDLTVGEAIDRYIESKDAVLSPSTIYGYKRVRTYALQDIMDIRKQSSGPSTGWRGTSRLNLYAMPTAFSALSCRSTGLTWCSGLPSPRDR